MAWRRRLAAVKLSTKSINKDDICEAVHVSQLSSAIFMLHLSSRQIIQILSQHSIFHNISLVLESGFWARFEARVNLLHVAAHFTQFLS